MVLNGTVLYRLVLDGTGWYWMVPNGTSWYHMVKNDTGWIQIVAYHMAGSSQPQHFFAAGCLFADFAIAVIFHPVIKLHEHYFAHYLGVTTLRYQF